MKEKWTGDVIGKLHTYEITYDELAAELDCTKGYVSLVLNGSRKPSGARVRFEKAVNDIIKRKQSKDTKED